MTFGLSVGMRPRYPMSYNKNPSHKRENTSHARERGKGVSTAHFSEDKMQYRYEEEQEYKEAIKRLHHVMQCTTDKGIADFLRIEESEVRSSKNLKIIPSNWFLRFFFVVYTMIGKSQSHNQKYSNNDYFNKEFDTFISVLHTDKELTERIMLLGKAALLADDSLQSYNQPTR